jgi:hypothetical protein
MNILTNVANIFKKYIRYDVINKLSNKQMRHNKNGILLHDAILYRFMYSEKIQQIRELYLLLMIKMKQP